LSLLYVDTSAILKRYFSEKESDECDAIFAQHSLFCFSRLGIAETVINLRSKLSAQEFTMAARLFEADTSAFTIIEFDKEICQGAIAVSDGRNQATLDSIHIASALKFKRQGIRFFTYDRAQALSAKRAGLATIGVLNQG